MISSKKTYLVCLLSFHQWLEHNSEAQEVFFKKKLQEAKTIWIPKEHGPDPLCKKMICKQHNAF